MAKTRLVESVIRFVSIISKDTDVSDWAIARIVQHWGDVVEVSATVPFEAGGYYEAEMGTGLKKLMVAAERPCDPCGLADWKLQTNEWERLAATTFRGKQARPLNLDPGYISQAKLVLATVKDRDHRIYLRDGIFAEITLSFIGGRWIAHRWTYPDYRIEEVASFATSCRDRLRDFLRENGAFRTGRKYSFLEPDL